MLRAHTTGRASKKPPAVQIAQRNSEIKFLNDWHWQMFIINNWGRKFVPTRLECYCGTTVRLLFHPFLSHSPDRASPDKMATLVKFSTKLSWAKFPAFFRRYRVPSWYIEYLKIKTYDICIVALDFKNLITHLYIVICRYKIVLQFWRDVTNELALQICKHDLRALRMQTPVTSKKTQCP